MRTTKELYINDQLIDFDDDNPIPFTLQVNDLGNLQSLQANYSKQFKIPLTQHNRIILGFPDDITITTNAPYEQLPGKYLEDGIEIISNGFAEIMNVDDKYANVMLLSGNADFLDKLGGQIYDMGDSTTPWSGFGASLVWAPYDHIWNVENAANSQKKTDGWIWPVVDYGDIDRNPPYAGLLNVRNMRPGFFLHTALELLVKSTGYNIDYDKSCLYSNPAFANLFQKMIVQFSNSDFEHGTDYQNTPDGLSLDNNYLGVQQVLVNNSGGASTNGTVNFNTQSYTATQNINGTATFQFALYMKGHYTGDHPTHMTFAFTLINASGTTNFAVTELRLDGNYTRLSGSGGGIIGEENFINQKISYDFELTAGDKLYVTYGIVNGIEIILKAGASFDFITSEKLVLWNQVLQCERILPDVSQLDFLKNILQKFGLILIADPNSGSIIFIGLKDIIANIPRARDWSDKCKDMGKQINFKLGNYSQVNWLRYQDDDSIPINYLPRYFADDHIDIDDKTLNPNQPVQDLFTSIFGPSINRPYFGGTIAQINNPTSTDFFSVGNAPRILIDQKYTFKTKPDGTGEKVIFADNDAGFQTQEIVIDDVISVPYFYKPDAPDLGGAARHLAFKDIGSFPGLRSTYYPELQNVLTRAKKVTRFFYLMPADINNFDFSIPVYLRQDGCFYYVSKIDSWNKGKPCKVDLVRL